ncbi:MAG: hypothetical protein ACLTXL_09905 [Clostridia bacterium]
MSIRGLAVFIDERESKREGGKNRSSIEEMKSGDDDTDELSYYPCPPHSYAFIMIIGL